MKLFIGGFETNLISAVSIFDIVVKVKSIDVIAEEETARSCEVVIF